MKFMNFARVVLAFAAVTGLSACGKTLGPYSVELNPTQNFDLESIEGKTLHLEVGKPVQATATFLGRKSLITMVVGADTVHFKGAKFDKNSGQIVVKAEKSGQGVGIVVSQAIVCNPNCEVIETTESEERCTYYTQQRRTRCYYAGNRVECYDEFESIPHRGMQWVEKKTTTKEYSVNASFADESHQSLAQASGSYQDIQKEFQTLSSCQ